MTRLRMQDELENARQGQARTFGEQVYQKKGVGGVRAEAAGGFAGVRETALPRLNAALNAGLSLNDAALCALTALMARTEDTNAVRARRRSRSESDARKSADAGQPHDDGNRRGKSAGSP